MPPAAPLPAVKVPEPDWEEEARQRVDAERAARDAANAPITNQLEPEPEKYPTKPTPRDKRWRST